jgi:glycerol-3-phosphate acyltransferase PlsY
MDALFWVVMGFFLGAMPFSVWLGRVFLKTDVRTYGDGNPGATNAWRAGGWRLGLPTLLLDYLKGAVPVSLANFAVGISGWGLVAVALAPVAGHAFSPFLRFRGGKAIAVTFGIWTGLTVAEGPVVLGLLMVLCFKVLDSHDWAVILAMVAFLGYLLLRGADLFLLAAWAGNMAIILWKYRADLQSWPRPQPWLQQLLRRNGG